MLRILSRSHSEDTATGYTYRVKHEGSTKTMEENELLSIPAGLAALDEFDQRHVYKAASPSKRQKIEDEPTRVADGPQKHQRICVKFHGKWKSGNVVNIFDGNDYDDQRPRYEILYDDGWRLLDRLSVPWCCVGKRRNAPKLMRDEQKKE